MSEDADAQYGRTELNREGTRPIFPPNLRDRNAWAGMLGRDRAVLDVAGWRRALIRVQAARACRPYSDLAPQPEIGEG